MCKRIPCQHTFRAPDAPSGQACLRVKKCSYLMDRRRAMSCSVATPSMAECCARRTNSDSMTWSTSCAPQQECDSTPARLVRTLSVHRTKLCPWLA